jgi:hypothetical protein
MIFFFEYGRLGNQLFQYAALKELYPNQRLVLFGFGTLKQAIGSVDAIIVEKEKLPRFLMAGLQRLFLMLSKLRIIGAIKETRENTGYVVKKTGGLLLNLRLLEPSYFQHQDVLEKINPSLRLNEDIFRKASDWLDEKLVKSSDQGLVFVHIRRGDYLTWPSCEYPAVLDKQWYVRAMDRMRAKVKNPIFLFLTDDPYYTKDCFGDQPDILISENDQLVDLALMSLCQHGILSASSFAWWGAWFSKVRSHEPGIYMAPKYWGGHRKAEWVPEGFITNWITYIE